MHICCIKYLIVIIFICSYVNLAAKDYVHRVQAPKDYPEAVFYLGFPLAVESDDFLNAYHNGIGGKGTKITTSPLFGVCLRASISPKIRMGISADYFNSSFQDYFEEININSNLSRTYWEKINSKTLPVLISLDYSAAKGQFKSYIGFGIGAAFNSIKWEETVNSNKINDKRFGGVIFNKTVIAPAFRIQSGLELGFNDEPGREFLGSLIIQAQYTYMYSRIDIFKYVRNQIQMPDADIKEKYAFIPGFLSLNLALSLNLLPHIPSGSTKK